MVSRILNVTVRRVKRCMCESESRRVQATIRRRYDPLEGQYDAQEVVEILLRQRFQLFFRYHFLWVLTTTINPVMQFLNSKGVSNRGSYLYF